ncbi:TRPT1, partial [Symbiodinium necroappetens]
GLDSCCARHSRWQKCIAAVPCQPGSQDLPDCIANELQDCDGREDQAFKANLPASDGLVELLNRGQPMKYINLAAARSCCTWKLPDTGPYDGWLGVYYEFTLNTFDPPVLFPRVAVLSSNEGNGISSTVYKARQVPYDRSEPASLEGTWYKSSALQGNEINCVCDAGTLMQKFNKSTLLVTFVCVEVPNLGACTEETSVQQTVDGSTSQIDVDCGKDRGLQAIQAEIDSKSRWTNFRFRCCQITANPVRMTKFGSGRVPPDPAEQGIYDAVARDDFGRPRYAGHDWSGRALGTLNHNADTGLWCTSFVATRKCVSSDLVNPLDQQLGGENWQAPAVPKQMKPLSLKCKEAYTLGSVHRVLERRLLGTVQVVPVSDFDAKFEAFGAKLPKRFQSKRKVPPQLTFAAEDPAYVPECKEESDPGSEKFDQTIMNEVAEELKDTDNPCGLVFSTPKTKKKKTGLPPDNFFGIPDIDGFGDVFGSEIDNDGEGMSYYAWNLDDVDQPGASGLTPKTVSECASREIKRDFKLAQWQREYEVFQQRLEFLEKTEAPLAALPEVQVGIFGVGITIKTGKIASNVVKAFRRVSMLNNEMRLWARDSRFATADNEDCSSLQHGLARIFCDLHCVRDAVKKGDAAILTSLEEGVSVLQREMPLGSAVCACDIVRNLFQAFVPDSSQSASLLAASQHEDFQQMRAGLATDVREMRQLLQRTASFVATMNDVLRAKTRTLGIYHAGASKSRQRQSTLYKGLQDELRELSFKATLRAMDASWWDLRRHLDRYLDSYDAYL